MATEEARIDFFEITKCGYYERGSSAPSFGSLSEVLGNFRNWAFAPGMEIGQTCTYALSDASDILRTFCLDHSVSSNEELLLATWNETETLNGSFASLNPAARPGNPDLDVKRIPSGNIPGYPSYFWFLPRQSLLATIRISGRLTGKRGLHKLLSEYLAKLSPNVACSEDGEISGYVRSHGDQPRMLYPSIDWHPRRKPAEIEFIRGNFREIRRIVRKNDLELSSADDAELMEKLLRNLGIRLNLLPREGTREVLRFKAEIDFSPTEEELDQVIAEWERGLDSGSKWDNIGFEIKGSPSTHWLSHSLVNTSVSIDIARDSNGLASAESVMRGLQTERAVIMASLD